MLLLSPPGSDGARSGVPQPVPPRRGAAAAAAAAAPVLLRCCRSAAAAAAVRVTAQRREGRGALRDTWGNKRAALGGTERGLAERDPGGQLHGLGVYSSLLSSFQGYYFKQQQVLTLFTF